MNPMPMSRSASSFSRANHKEKQKCLVTYMSLTLSLQGPSISRAHPAMHQLLDCCQLFPDAMGSMGGGMMRPPQPCGMQPVPQSGHAGNQTATETRLGFLGLRQMMRPNNPQQMNLGSRKRVKAQSHCVPQ